MSREGCAKDMRQAEAGSGAQHKSFKVEVAMSSFSFSVVLSLKPEMGCNLGAQCIPGCRGDKAANGGTERSPRHQVYQRQRCQS